MMNGEMMEREDDAKWFFLIILRNILKREIVWVGSCFLEPKEHHLVAKLSLFVMKVIFV